MSARVRGKIVRDHHHHHQANPKTDDVDHHTKRLAYSLVQPLPPRPLSVTLVAPPIPPKVELSHITYINDLPSSAPPLPPKIELDTRKEAFVEKIPWETPCDLEQSTFQDKPRLRMLNIPDGLEQAFLSIAKSNTAKDIETCGILCGKLESNILKMTTLIIPKQSGASDRCTTENEEEVFEHQDKNNLLTIGWIHTHPSQTCFLSSVDLHTQYAYQVMLPEAVAIVCAPRHPDKFGIFRLTDPPGMGVISHCKSENAFHPHPELSIYTDAAHVRLLDTELEIVDLRLDECHTAFSHSPT
ncbi:hypothetical protein EC973_002837 [Apophysomyces ossiformis]|uniref:MPN domain-containing protein n=1 Tax=Apophysomyces ossiformis TaxID=679940 RepID=A0A8H7BN75_9FUNG|nr:hypothetical protein EC973_002837 [Apophysomyces ossiformis]